MEIRIDPEFEKLIRPLTDDEKNGLRAKLEAEGCWQPFAVWTPEDGDAVPILLDGHNRYAWCVEQHASYKLQEIPNITTREDAKHWIIENQLRRRNLTQYEAIALARIDEEILKKQAEERMKANLRRGDENPARLHEAERGESLDVNETIAKKAGTSRDTVRKQKFIDRWGTEEEKESLRLGNRSIRSVYQDIEERLLLDMWQRTEAGETQRDIATRLGVSQPNVNKWLKKARERFAEEEEEDGNNDEHEGEKPLEDPDTRETEAVSTDAQSYPVVVEDHMTKRETEDAEGPTYFDDSLDAYKRWIDTFTQHIALVGGLHDVGGMQKIAARFSHERRGELFQKILSIRDEWNHHLDDLSRMLSSDLIQVGGKVIHG